MGWLQRFALVALGAAGLIWPPTGDAATNAVLNLKDGLTAGTLRSVIANALPGDTLVFSNRLTGTISLTNGGQLLLNKNLIIEGPGARVITISGNNSSRVFNITNATVSISGLTIARGRVTGTNGISGGVGETVVGGGILRLDSVAGYSVTFSDCLFLENSVIGGAGSPAYPGTGRGGGSAYGGAVFNNSLLTMKKCCFAGNYALGGSGGFGSFAGGTGGTGLGSGVCNVGELTMTNCTFAANLAIGGTGGSIAGNIGAPGGGGNGEGAGLYDSGQSVLVSCTISSNTAAGGDGGTSAPGGVGNGPLGGAYGGGVRAATSKAEICSTIIAWNVAAQASDVSGTFISQGYNFISITNGSSGFSAVFDQTGTTISPINPMLGPLQDNGGPTPSFALLTNSPAIDQGNSFGVSSDQRGAPRPADFSFIPNPDDSSDIGAFELIPPLLNIASLSTHVLLSWSAFNVGYSLQSTTNLPASNWDDVTQTPGLFSGRLYVTNIVLGEPEFFRLRSP